MNFKEKYDYWRNSSKIDEEFRKELESIKDDDKEIEERFCKNIEFGTAGMRGLLGVGLNRINKYTVRRVTQGYADYIRSKGIDACRRGVVIACDNRRCSEEFSRETAGVLAANGVKAFLFDSLRPTPELSFAVREMGAFGGVMITASHNPPEYNGYKLYDERGCQLVPSIMDEVVKYVNAVEDPLNIKSLTLEAAGELVEKIDTSMDEKYYEAVMSIALDPDVEKNIKIVYSPQHGTGNIPVREVLGRFGYNVIPVAEQCEPDTEFSNTKNPNPEVAVAYDLALEYAEREDADIVIITDPDCDRLGVAVKKDGEYILMTGNQSAAVILEYILEQRTLKNTMPQNPVMFNTIVTSNIGDAICKAYGVEVEKTLTGFKFIGDKVYTHELKGDKNFVFGYEESYGCLIADFVRDKDAVQASVMLCECAAYYKQKGMTLIDALNAIYSKYGYYLDAVDSFTFAGLEGEKRIRSIVEELRRDPPTEINGIKVATLEDFTSEEIMKKGFLKSNVLRFVFEDGSWVAVRPSGTEPKCKFYFCVCGENEEEADKKLADLRAVLEKNC